MGWILKYAYMSSIEVYMYVFSCLGGRGGGITLIPQPSNDPGGGEGVSR